jgi:tetratricopeptide (TPR) repeat protein
VNSLDPKVVAARIRQAATYPKSRRALEREIEANPESWIPSLIAVAGQGLESEGTTVEGLLLHFREARPDFQSRFWLYQEIPGKSVHFLRIKVALARWIIDQLDPAHPQNRTLLAQMNLNLSQHLRDGGQVTEAPPFSKRALGLYEDLVASNPELAGDLVWGWMLHAQQLSESDRHPEALQANRSAVQAAMTLKGPSRNRLLGQACVALGATLVAMRHQKLALEPLRQGYRLLKRCEGAGHEYEAIAASGAVYLADALLDLGQEKEALAYAEEALRGFGILVANDSGTYLKDYLWATNVASRVAIALGDLERSRRLRYEGVQLLLGLSDRNPRGFLIQLLLHLMGLVSALIDEQQFDEAERYVQQALKLGKKWGRLKKAPPAIFLGSSYAQLASVRLGQQRLGEGLRAALRARLYLKQLPSSDPDRTSLLPTVEEQIQAFRRFQTGIQLRTRHTAA